DFRNDTPIEFMGAPAFPDGIQPISQPVDLEAWTGEARYTSSQQSPIRWIAGVFAQKTARARVDDFGPLLFGAEPSEFDTPVRQLAAFAQGEVRVTRNIDATLALRYDNVRIAEDITGVTS